MRSVVMCVLCSCSFAHAGWVEVGQPGNPPIHSTWGTVDYSYKASDRPVTNQEFIDFLNETKIPYPLPRGLSGMSYWHDGAKFVLRTSDDPRFTADARAVGMDWISAARYVNWIHNDRGDTETGVYDIAGAYAEYIYTPFAVNLLRFPGRTEINRNPNAKVWLPSREEALKAGTLPNWGSLEFTDTVLITANWRAKFRDWGQTGTPWLNVTGPDLHQVNMASNLNGDWSAGIRLFAPSDTPQVTLLGDADADGDLDSADVLAFTAAWTGTQTPRPDWQAWTSRSDTDRDGDVDAADLTTVIGNWTGSSSAVVAAVPEPGAAGWLMVLILGLRSDGRRTVNCA